MIETRKREHSRKPDEQYQLIESCSPGPYLEMFARYPRENWVVWGDEAAGDAKPRGVVHKGYRGGDFSPAIELPAPGISLSAESRSALATSIRQEYEEGASIRELASDHGYSLQKIRTLLEEADTALRPRGRSSAKQ